MTAFLSEDKGNKQIYKKEPLPTPMLVPCDKDVAT